MLRGTKGSGIFSLIIGGVMLIFFGFSIAGPQLGTGDWSHTDGVVTECSMSNYYDWQQESYVLFYAPDVHYQYSVDGYVYESDLISVYNVSTTDSTIAYDYIEKYPVGSTVRVYYDPQYPYSSVLERGGNSLGGYLQLIGSILLAIGIVLVVYPLIKMKRSRTLEGGTDYRTRPSFIRAAMSIGIALIMIANFIFRDNLAAYVLLIGVGVVAILMALVPTLRNLFSPRSRDVRTDDGNVQGASIENTVYDEPKGMISMAKEIVYDPEMPMRLADRLNSMGFNAIPLSKEDNEIAEHRHLHGIFGDPIIAAVKVDNLNFNALEVWRINGQGGPGNWFIHYFIFVVRGDLGPDPKTFNVDLDWKADRNGEVSEIIWNGGRLGEMLQYDTKLTQLVLDMGLPGVHIGRPGMANYVITSNVKLGYVAIQLLPRDGELYHDGMALYSKVGWGKDDIPDRTAIELVDRIAEHVRKLMRDVQTS